MRHFTLAAQVQMPGPRRRQASRGIGAAVDLVRILNDGKSGGFRVVTVLDNVRSDDGCRGVGPTQGNGNPPVVPRAGDDTPAYNNDRHNRGNPQHQLSGSLGIIPSLLPSFQQSG